MAETTADVRRDIELTRERMSSTLNQLERKLNVSQIVKDNPWPAVGVAFGAGLLLSGTKSDVKAGVATLAATKGASNRLAPALDDIVARLMQGVGAALQGHVDTLIDDVKRAIGAPVDGASSGASGGMGFADVAGSSATGSSGSMGGGSSSSYGGGSSSSTYGGGSSAGGMGSTGGGAYGASGSASSQDLGSSSYRAD
jgi:hypothetical protein